MLRSILSIGFCAALAVPATAQMTHYGVDPSTVANFGSGTFYNDAYSYSSFSVPGKIGVNVKGDQAVVFPTGSGGGADVGQRIWDSFRVGFGPLLVTKLRVHGDGRIIAGGGSGPYPETQLYSYAYLYEYRDYNGTPGFQPGGDSTIAYFASTPITTPRHNGMGYWDETVDVAWTGNLVLASYTNYVVLFDTLALGGIPNGYPSASSTLEYGGPHAPWYSGFTMEMDYTVLPEPSSFGVLALGFLVLRRRRR